LRDLSCLIPYLTNRFGSRPGKTTPSVETVALFLRKDKTVLEVKGTLANKELERRVQD